METINKQALLEWLEMQIQGDLEEFEWDRVAAFRTIEHAIHDCRFDQPPDSDRLRVALVRIQQYARNEYMTTFHKIENITIIVDEALSTTTEPVGPSWQHVKPGEFVEYSDNLSGARLDHIKILSKIKRMEDSTNG